MFYPLRALVATALLASVSCAFSVDQNKIHATPAPANRKAAAVAESSESSRRSLLVGGGAALVTAVTTMGASFSQPANAAGNTALGAGTVVGREIDTFNSLIYNFKNIDLGGGLDASTLKEPSVPFVEFGEKMKAGELISMLDKGMTRSHW